MAQQVVFSTVLLKFDKKGEKTGWTYLEIPENLALKLNPHTRSSFRVKGWLDSLPIKLVALLPMGNGAFILPVNATMRRGLCKQVGATVALRLEEDLDPLPTSEDFLVCLADDATAQAFFEGLPKGHQNYYTKWIESAKTIETKAKRISMSIQGFRMGLGYGEMIRHFKHLQHIDH